MRMKISIKKKENEYDAWKYLSCYLEMPESRDISLVNEIAI